jgi:hypothetical protein
MASLLVLSVQRFTPYCIVARLTYPFKLFWMLEPDFWSCIVAPNTCVLSGVQFIYPLASKGTQAPLTTAYGLSNLSTADLDGCRIGSAP